MGHHFVFYCLVAQISDQNSKIPAISRLTKTGRSSVCGMQGSLIISCIVARIYALSAQTVNKKEKERKEIIEAELFPPAPVLLDFMPSISLFFKSIFPKISAPFDNIPKTTAHMVL